MTPDIVEIRKWLEGYKEARRTRALKSHSEHIKTVAALYPDTTDLGEIAYLFVREIPKRPVCENCGEPVSWFGNRFAKTCSITCSNKLLKKAEKAQATMRALREEDPEYEAKRSDARLKTMREKYGDNVGPNHRAKHPETWTHLNKKGRETLLARYGVLNPGQLPDHAEKLVSTSMRKHGVSHGNLSADGEARIGARRHERIASLLPEKIALEEIIPADTSSGQANYRYALRCTCGWRGELPSETFKFRMRTLSDVCTKCTGISSARSIKERNLCEFIRSIYDGPIIENDRSTVKVLKTGNKRSSLEIDVLLPDLKLGFEFSGLFWHSTSDPTDDDARTYHRNKHLAAAMAGIRLVTIFEDEWDARRPIVEHRLRSMLGCAEERVFARKCTIGAVTAAQARSFCEAYHIQGYTPSTHKYGLFQEGALVAVMTFSRPTIAKGKRGALKTDWELSRFCSSKTIVGGASRLFKHFVKTEAPTSILTYSDLRWNTGDVYKTLGFVSAGISRPNYWYVQDKRRINRFALRKTDADDPNLTEFQNRSAQGWRWIWDCGNAKYLWRPQ